MYVAYTGAKTNLKWGILNFDMVLHKWINIKGDSQVMFGTGDFASKPRISSKFLTEQAKKRLAEKLCSRSVVCILIFFLEISQVKNIMSYMPL